MPSWLTYASMPLIAGMIGWLTKIAAVEMMFRPIEFKGIPPYLGWQGVVPRSAARMAGIFVDLMLRSVFQPRELIERLDVDVLTAQLQKPIELAVDRMTRETMMELQPTLWEALPESAKRLLIRRVVGEVPAVMRSLVEEMKENLDDVVDIRQMAVEAMIRDKAMTNRMLRAAGQDAFRFIIRFGIPSGIILGGLQAVIWYYTKTEWVVPAFGAVIGLTTDWLALQMVFRPVRPKRILGVVKWQGLFHKKRANVTRDYSALMANELMTPVNLLEAIMTGPRSDRFFHLIDRQVGRVVDSRSGLLKPLVVLAVGGGKYSLVKRKAAAAVVAEMRASQDLADEANNLMDTATFFAGKMDLMSAEEYEGLLRPAFKQDEWKIVVVGAVLGFLVGELQVHLLLT